MRKTMEQTAEGCQKQYKIINEILTGETCRGNSKLKTLLSSNYTTSRASSTSTSNLSMSFFQAIKFVFKLTGSLLQNICCRFQNEMK